MDNKEAQDLLKKFSNGQCTEQEKQLLDSWFVQLKSSQGLHPVVEQELNEDLDQVWQSLKASLPERAPLRTVTVWLRFAAAAVILIVAGTSLFLFVNHQARKNQSVYVNNVSPGTNKAYLTLSNGKRVVLNNTATDTLHDQTGMQISQTAQGQLVYSGSANTANSGSSYNTIETPRGGQYEVVLPDGTKIWLNAASSLKYPASFAGLKNRTVELKGEAYFEVTHNASQPFIVKTSQQQVEDLGTHFNISSYAEENETKTSLFQGSVKVSGNTLNCILKPGQQSVLAAATLKVIPDDAEATIAWKNGNFLFNHEHIESIMKKLSRWYNIDVQYEGAIPDDWFAGSVARSQQLNDVLRKLELTGQIHFKVEGRRVVVMP
ncbi:FecR family protein [Pedobacter sp. L105]|uniref:FecR family protein n=1 Tax=Pedobacter sp. L105 TaxID=1641871 RepID=UPI00131EA37B|nr:FecR family protein [Pedobacter sp. L105]